ncbi:MAG: hypothetical protein OEM26_03270, partial [Saprospiraceae bacterium]|nr:hypothetical protein [Saprospiraceae bacterium]
VGVTGRVHINDRSGIGINNPSIKLHIDGGNDTSPSKENLVTDNNEIMARNDGAVATLFLNKDGGHVGVGTSNPSNHFHVTGPDKG